MTRSFAVLGTNIANFILGPVARAAMIVADHDAMLVQPTRKPVLI